MTGTTDAVWWEVKSAETAGSTDNQARRHMAAVVITTCQWAAGRA